MHRNRDRGGKKVGEGDGEGVVTYYMHKSEVSPITVAPLSLGFDALCVLQGAFPSVQQAFTTIMPYAM